MSRLLKYFRKSPVPSKSKGTHVILSSLVNPIDAAEPAKGIMALDNGQLRLPPELLILIMTYIHRKRDLASLCMVSQMFRNIAAPMLYRIVEIEPKGSDVDIAGHLILYRTLQDDRYSQFVIEFHCTIRRQAVCVNYVHSTVKSHNSSRCCSCDDYDRALGKALLCLSNLQVLDLQCQLCPLVHFHDYLHSLQAPKLRELTLTLTCCGANSVEGPSKEPKSILLAPYMRNIAALALSCGYDWLRGKTMEYGQYPLEADILLNLRTLGHNGLDICDYLLMARPIERMCIAHASWEETPRLHHTISLSPGKLSHLFMANILGWLPRAMEEGLEPYRHLRYVGTIVFSRLEEAAGLNEMRVFNQLRRLEMVEIDRMQKPRNSGYVTVPFQYVFSPKPDFLDLLTTQHPTLRRVLLISRQYLTRGSVSHLPPVLWERRDVWERRVISNLSYWEILNDRLDHF